MSSHPNKHTVVIGGGIIGVCSALELVRLGRKVTLIDPVEPGGRGSASYGHGCWISPASVVPMSMPGLWKQVPRYLFDPNGPLVIRWRNIFRLAPWLFRFVQAGSSVARVEKTAMALRGLLQDGPARHQAMAGDVGCSDLIRHDGLLYAYPSRQAFEAEALAWHLRRITGLKWVELDRRALLAREPNLAAHYNFGILAVDGAHCIDPGAYVKAIADAAFAGGARHVSASVKNIVFDGSRVTGVGTNEAVIACDEVVVASGAWSKQLAKMAGDHIPLESERGYHAVVPLDHGGPSGPVMPSDGKMANTPTRFGLRLSGQVELASLDTPPNWKRADILFEHARRTYPQMVTSGATIADRWMGHRPSTPDGLPVIGRSSRSPDVFYAFGHGHVGFASGPITGRIVADALAGALSFDIAPYSPRRFRFGGDRG